MNTFGWFLVVLGLLSHTDPPPAAPPPAPAQTDKQPATSLPTTVRSSETPGVGAKNEHYVMNREPLAPTPLIKLPVGQIIPRDWLNGQLRMLRDNYYGELPRISDFLKDESGWLAPDKPAGEEAALWVRGFGLMGFELKDHNVMDAVKRWVDGALASQDSDGYFGPKANKDKKNFRPNMIMLHALRARHEAAKDERVLTAMTKYFRYRHDLSSDDFYPAKWDDGEKDRRRLWQHARAADEAESVYWLYNRTGDKWLLELAERIQKKGADWTSGEVSKHGANIAHGFRSPAIFFQQSGDKKLLESVKRNYKTIFDEYGQMPGGMFAADEHVRPGKTGPQQASEACAMIEMMHSLAALTTITGEPAWADHLEDVAYNSYVASISPDLRAVRRLTAPNMVKCDKGDKSPGFELSGMSAAFDPKDYDCCVHNAGYGWPLFAEHAWFATGGNGLAAILYAPCEVRAKVGDGTDVSISVTTDYPFTEDVEMKLSTPKPVAFPLTLRIPEWCEDASLAINGETKLVRPTPKAYVIVERTWSEGDTIKLTLPMKIRTKKWKKQNDAVSVHRGPFAYTWKIDEEWTRSGDRIWPNYEVLPKSAWNYALAVDSADPAAGVSLSPQKGMRATQIFYGTSALHRLLAKVYEIPQWQLDKHGLPEAPPASPVKVEPASPKEVEMVPMGCNRLRISVFPTAGPEPGK